MQFLIMEWPSAFHHFCLVLQYLPSHTVSKCRGDQVSMLHFVILCCAIIVVIEIITIHSVSEIFNL
jgi:hypothetical protein